MTDDLHPTAQKVREAETMLRTRKIMLAKAKAARNEALRLRLAALVQAIEDEPDATNVDLARRFGFESETSVRNVRLRLASESGAIHA